MHTFKSFARKLLLTGLLGAASLTPAIANGEHAAHKAAAPPKLVSHARFAKNVDAFGVDMIEPTLAGGHSWFAKWDHPRSLSKGQTDPLDPEFQNRGEGRFDIQGGGIATASGTVMRQYVWDQSRKREWGNVEVTFYAMRETEVNAPAYAGFTIEVRTDDGHVDDPSRQCAGSSYSVSMYYDGRAEFKKELKHPLYSAINPTAMIWPGHGSLPKGVWVGFKAVVKDEPNGVSLTLFRDMTDGVDGGEWMKVLDYVDQGEWKVGNGAAICGHPADRQLRGAHPIVLLRNDNSTMRYKKASIREIVATPR